MQRSFGFALSELMIAVAVIGILAAIAIVNDNEYLLRGRISEKGPGAIRRRVPDRGRQPGQRNRQQTFAQGRADRAAGTGGDDRRAIGQPG